MLGMVEKIDRSEYGNAIALYGLENELDNPALFGAINTLPALQRIKTLNKLTQPPLPSKGSRAEMEKHFAELPAHVKTQLAQGDLRLADTIVFSIKPTSSKTIKMFESSDTKAVGLRSLSEGRLQKSQVLLVSGIILLAGVAGGDTTDFAMITNFAKIESIPALANGEFSLKANKKIIVPEGTSNRVFCTDNYNGVPFGYYKLANPRLIHDDVAIEMVIELGSLTGIAANTHLFVGLHGTMTTP